MYPGGTLVTFSQFNANAAPAGMRNGQVEFHGTKGTLYIQHDGHEIVPDTIKQHEFPAETPLDRTVDDQYHQGEKPLIEGKKVERPTIGIDEADALHARNFIDCIRSRERCHCDIETGHHSTTATLIANIAHKTKSCLEWDAQNERFTNNTGANQHLSYEYQAPYKLPG
jgi:predicted dehydrogenase